MSDSNNLAIFRPKNPKSVRAMLYVDGIGGGTYVPVAVIITVVFINYFGRLFPSEKPKFLRKNNDPHKILQVLFGNGAMIIGYGLLRMVSDR